MKLSVPDDTVNVNENIYISFCSATKKTKKKKEKPSGIIKYFNALSSY